MEQENKNIGKRKEWILETSKETVAPELDVWWFRFELDPEDCLEKIGLDIALWSVCVCPWNILDGYTCTEISAKSAGCYCYKITATTDPDPICR